MTTHITDDSPIAEHCSIFSLSDPSDEDLRQSCTHVHDQTCGQCTSLASALSDMEKLLGEIPFCSEDDRDEASYPYRNAALAIRAWKCHLLRTVRQYQARFDHSTFLMSRPCYWLLTGPLSSSRKSTENPRPTGLGREGYRGIPLLRTAKLNNSFSRVAKEAQL